MKKPRRDRILLSKATSFLFDRHVILSFCILVHTFGEADGVVKQDFQSFKSIHFVCQSVLNDLKVSKLY